MTEPDRYYQHLYGPQEVKVVKVTKTKVTFKARRASGWSKPTFEMDRALFELHYIPKP